MALTDPGGTAGFGLGTALSRTVRDCLNPGLWGVLGKALLWTALALGAGLAAVLGLLSLLPDPVAVLPLVGPVSPAPLQGMAAGGLLILSGFLMLPLTGLMLGFLVEDIAAAVERRHYPGLPPPRGERWTRAAAQGIGFAAVVVAANLALMPVSLIAGPLAPVVVILVNGWLFGREFFAAIAGRRLEPGAARALRGRIAGRVLVAGTLIALPLGLPLANLAVPLFGVVLFAHLVAGASDPGAGARGISRAAAARSTRPSRA